MNPKSPDFPYPKPGDPLYPRKVKDLAGNERTVVNEICTCSHYRTQHHPRCVVSIGHGPCSQCECGQYTWKGFVYGGVSPEVDEFIATLGPDVPFGIKEIFRLTEHLEAIELEKEALMNDANESHRAERNAYAREHKARIEKNELRARVKKLEEKLKEFIDPFVVAKGERRSILLEPPNDGNKHTRRRNRLRKT